MIARIGLGELLWSLFVLYLMVMYFVVVFSIITDIFRSDMSGGKKAMWSALLFFFPIITMIVYLIKNGDSMGKRNLQAMQRQKDMTDTYIREAAGTGGAASELEKAKSLLDSGAIDADDYAKLKAKILG
jgi:Phospholipase_D-nuclease N-terminal/Short C-terminal domain